MRSSKMSIAIASTLAMLLLILTSAQAASQTAQERAAQRVEEPERHFHEASKYFAQTDNQNAAHEIRSGAALLKREASRHNAPNKVGLQAAALELDTLAAKVAKARSLRRISSTRSLPGPTSRWPAIAISWPKRRSPRATTSRPVAGSKLPPITSRTRQSGRSKN
jgi:hypothetical protein